MKVVEFESSFLYILYCKFIPQSSLPRIYRKICFLFSFIEYCRSFLIPYRNIRSIWIMLNWTRWNLRAGWDLFDQISRLSSKKNTTRHLMKGCLHHWTLYHEIMILSLHNSLSHPQSPENRWTIRKIEYRGALEVYVKETTFMAVSRLIRKCNN